MDNFAEFAQLDERYVNLVGNDPRKHQYADEVHKMLQQSYASIGGIHGDGFKDPEDMKANIPFWKLHIKNGKVKAASFYKDTAGRKRVAIATDGSVEGKLAVAQMSREEIDHPRAWGEASGPSLQFMKRRIGVAKLQANLIHPDVVAKMTGKTIRKPPANDPELLAHPEFKDHFYQREIGGHWHTKVAIGHMGHTIK